MSWRIFYSYAHEDAALRQRLATYLAPLKQQKKIVEWHDRQIMPGSNWDNEISENLDSADLILFLVSADFLASDYIFGVEVDRALARLKRQEAKVVPVLLRPCLWEDSRFSELQFIPRDGIPISESRSADEALKEVAKEIRNLVSYPPPVSEDTSIVQQPQKFDSALDLVRDQIGSYSRLYERTRLRMRASSERTSRMEGILRKMRDLAVAAYPLLDELANSPSPGERLSAVAILQVFAAEKYLPFLGRLVASEKPFIGYHAIKALHFAVGAIDPRSYAALATALEAAERSLQVAAVGLDTDRHNLLRLAKNELTITTQALASVAPRND